MLGGWQRLSFRANDLFIDRARSFCEKHIAEKYNDEYICSPMEVYSQVVNGKNFKVLLLGKHFKTNDFKCFSSVTWVPASQRPQPEFKEDTFKSTDGTECKLTAEKSDKLKSSVKAFFKADKEFTPVKFFENALDGANVYVLKVGEQFVGVYEVGDEMTVDCVLN